MTMTRQHFQLIAKEFAIMAAIIDENRGITPEFVHNELANSLASALATNPNFDRDRFLKAAGAS